MADVVVVGAGLGGLSVAMLLARDGNRVTVLERDPAVPPDPGDAWDAWDRRGVNQFRLLHFIQPCYREVLEAELPEVCTALESAGALRFNPLVGVPEPRRGGEREGDGRFDALTGRRPVFEAVLARCAQEADGLEVRRGTGVAGLLTGTPAAEGVPHVIGVRTDAGEELRADLVVDAAGRRSALPAWLAAIDARSPYEEKEDSGFVYYGRHFTSADGALPPVLGPLLQDCGSVSVLTLPADNGTWGVGIITAAGDAELRGLRDPERWSAALARLPLVAHWAEGEPIDGVAVMAAIEDRYRRFVVDGMPVGTGVLAVGDSWACTNPSVGRGASIAVLHAAALRDLLQEEPLDDPVELALAWDSRTAETVEPWYRATLSFDQHRLAEMVARRHGEPYEPDDPSWAITKALMAGAGSDPDVLRAFLAIGSVLELPDQALARPGVFERVLAIGDGWRDAPPPGPPRDELVGALA